MGRSGDTRELDKAVGDRDRLAQANRFIRYCREQGVSAHEVMDGTVVLDLTPIQDANSKIIPEAVDYNAVRARVTGRRS